MPANGFHELIPPFAECVLHIGEIRAEAARSYGSRCLQVWHLERNPPHEVRLAADCFDCIVVESNGSELGARSACLDAIIPNLHPNGWISCVHDVAFPADHFIDENDAALLGVGLLRLKTVRLLHPAGDGVGLGIVAVRRDYNPVMHARELALRRRFAHAIEVLDDIPHELVRTTENLSYLAAEKQRLCLEWQKSLPAGEAVHKLFFKARREFAQVTVAMPHHHPAYRCEAEFWRHVGNLKMARRTLRSILHAAPDETTSCCLAALPETSKISDSEGTAPEWSGTRRPPRMLILTHEHSDYGIDTLYDGLCRTIGAEHIVEYPWKPMLHGQNRDAAFNYPCVFHHPSPAASLEDLLEELGDGRFDVIVYADVVQMTRKAEVRRILEAGRDIPLVVYDTWDSCYTPTDLISRYTGDKPIALVLKREMLTGVDYGPMTFPMPFGFPDPLVPEPVDGRRVDDLFWAGKRVWSLRPLYLPRIEQIVGRSFQESYDQAEYSRRLRAARIGLSIFGSGFDTVRYWEIPAHGVMLLAERPPIRIPHNFRNGESAVFFDDLPELEEKLDHYLSRTDEVRQIAAEGHRHFMKYHTSSARARQFLGYLETHLNW